MTKDEFRQECKIKVARLSFFTKRQRSYSINNTLSCIIKKCSFKTVFIYMPLVNEPDVLKIIKFLKKNGRVLIPFMQESSLKMVEYRVPLYKKKFGIYEPKAANGYRGKVELAIIPIVGFDKQMARIGHGMGFYDRFFAKIKQKPLIVFVTLDESFFNGYLGEPHDITADAVIDAKNIYVRSKVKNVGSIISYRSSGSCWWNRICHSKKA